MAKKPAATAEADVAETPASAEDVALAVRAVMDITGAGEPGARDQVAKMRSSKVARIAELERTDDRIEIVAIIYS